MARILTKTQSLLSHSLKSSQPLIPLSINRYRSFKPELVEINLDSSSATSDSGTEAIEKKLEDAIEKKLEDTIHRLIVQNSSPDWLPFIPGSSFWVPPTSQAAQQSHTVANLVTKLANHLTEEESLSFVTPRGWPCSSFLIQDAKKEDEAEVAEEEGDDVQVKVLLVPLTDNKST
ncbi:hypothetical protein KPL71_002514 [Citrus sinensis]|uniref:Uncharacterized protein n=1 Tax=Citrus sinensis TaxID=2711 RepID=A0ACB8P5P5_CITSI|nr:hypothetical protein KPL71_002514 [Citrus sinensis]